MAWNRNSGWSRISTNMTAINNPDWGGNGQGFENVPPPTVDTTTTTVTPPPPPPPTPVDNRTHYMDAFRAYFASLGMTVGRDLEIVLSDALAQGYTDADIAVIMPDIQNTQSFKNRFPGFEAYKANHNGVAIDIGEYIRLEQAYTDIMRNAGLPSGFYDDVSDFGTFIANGVSPEEISNRVQMATTAAQQVDPTMRNLMAQFYGLSTGDVAAYFLDPNRATPVIEKQYKTAEVASWAARNGYAVTDMTRYQNLMESGVTGAQAAQGYGTVRQLDQTLGGIAGIYGESYSQSDAEQDVFFNKSEKRQRIVRQETATFSGSSRGATGSAQRQSY